MDKNIHRLIEKIQYHAKTGSPVAIRGFGSKSFYGNREVGERLSSESLQGIVEYDPSELVLTARAGTPVQVIREALDEHHQMLAFEPIEPSGLGSIGGTVATGLAGARRPWSGGVRDYVLGLHLVNGRGEYCRFGGQVMKNVAGYDVSRLMVGAMGCLGMLTQISVKVLPKPQLVRSAKLNLPLGEFLHLVKPWMKKMTPVTGVCHDGSNGYIRLEGFGKTVEEFASLNSLKTSGELNIWEQLRRQDHEIFKLDEQTKEQKLWRLNLPKWTNLEDLNLPYLMDWAGGQYWVRSSDCAPIEKIAAAHNGHFCLYQNGENQAFAPLSSGVMMLHKNLKQAYDPKRIFNPGRLFEGL